MFLIDIFKKFYLYLHQVFNYIITNPFNVPNFKKQNLHIMKNFKIILVLLVLFGSFSSKAQPPLPPDYNEQSLPIDPKTNCQLRYSYFPNLYAYYDNLKNVYFYQMNGQWQTASELPQNYGGYSLYNKAHVAITNFEEENPQQFLKIHKKLYPYNSKGRFMNATASTE